MTEDKKYYLSINDENVGPLSFAEITDRLKNGLLSAEDHIFTTNNAVWTPIKDIPELSDYISKISPEEKKVWFLRKNKENIGPISKNEILSLLLNAEVDNNDYVWRKGLGNWMQIKDVYELRATKDSIEKIEANGKKTLEQMPKQTKDEIEETSSGEQEEKKDLIDTKPNIRAIIKAVEAEEPAIKKKKMQLPERSPLELIERKTPKEETMKEQLPPLMQTPNKETNTQPNIILAPREAPVAQDTPVASEKIPAKAQKKLIPEFILGIILTLLGGYQINNNLMIGSGVAIIGIIMVLAYLIANRKKGTKNATDK